MGKDNTHIIGYKGNIKMIKVRYRSMMRVSDVLEEKIMHLERERAEEMAKLDKVAIFIRKDENGENKPEESAPRASRYDVMLSDLREFLSAINSEIDSIDFTLGVDRWKNNNQSHNQLSSQNPESK